MYLLASKSGIVTGRNLADKLGLRFHSNPDNINRRFVDVIIRYGNARTPDNIRIDTNTNSVESILRMSNKSKLSEYLKEDNIIVPKYIPYTYGQRLPTGIRFPVLARKFFHRGGLDITICYTERDIPRDVEALVPFYRTSREYRVHVAFGEIAKIFHKLTLGNNPEGPGAHIRTSYYGWSYRLADKEQIKYGDKLEETALAAAKTIGATFCGVDMAWSPKLEQWIIWEINSAPALNESSLDLYKQLIIKNFREKYGNRHDIRKPV